MFQKELTLLLVDLIMTSFSKGKIGIFLPNDYFSLRDYKCLSKLIYLDREHQSLYSKQKS